MDSIEKRRAELRAERDARKMRRLLAVVAVVPACHAGCCYGCPASIRKR
jgi:hypothetical protein